MKGKKYMKKNKLWTNEELEILKQHYDLVSSELQKLLPKRFKFNI